MERPDEADLRDSSFKTLAHQSVRRIGVSRWLELLSRSSVPLFIVAMGVVVTLWKLEALGSLWVEPLEVTQSVWVDRTLIALAVVGGWLLITASIAWWRRPNPIRALASLDERLGHRDMFVSAYCFVEEGEQGRAIDLHLHMARKKLPQLVEDSRSVYPWRVTPWMVLLPVAFVALVASPFLVTPRLVQELGGEDRPALDESEKERLAEETERMREELAERMADRQGLEKEEEEEWEALEEGVKTIADRLRKVSDKQKKDEALAELEKKAAEAEKLARKLGAGSEQLSSRMLAELERHVDTVELAGALRGKKYDKAAQETNALAAKLENPELQVEARLRIHTAFGKALGVATPEDKATLTGKHLAEAHAKLEDKKPKEAGAVLRKLAKVYERRAQRVRKQKQLRQLAKSLRMVGQRVSGRTQKVRRLGTPPQDGVRRMAHRNVQLPDGRQRDFEEVPAGPDPEGPQRLIPLQKPPVPGAKPGEFKPGEGEEGGEQVPVPGQGAPMPGGAPAPGGGGKAPVPGMKKPGGGGAPFKKKDTKPGKAGQTKVVKGRKGVGPSSTHTAEGRDPREVPLRRIHELRAEFMRAEEAALTDQTLPASRRDQVRRYFQTLRRMQQKMESKKP